MAIEPRYKPFSITILANPIKPPRGFMATTSMLATCMAAASHVPGLVNRMVGW